MATYKILLNLLRQRIYKFKRLTNCMRTIKRFIRFIIARIYITNKISAPNHNIPQDNRDELLYDLFISGNVNKIESEFISSSNAIKLLTEHSISQRAYACYKAAIFIESMSSRYTDNSSFLLALHSGEILLQRSLEEAPFWIELSRALGRNLWFQCRINESIHAFSKAEKLRDNMAKMLDWPVDDRIYLPRNCTEIIGLMGHLDGIVKYKIQTNDQRPYFLLADQNNIVNMTFLKYWEPYISIIYDKDSIAKHAIFESVYGVNWNWVMPHKTDLSFVHEGLSAIHHEWYQASKSPLLTLHSRHEQILLKALNKWGMRPNDKYICLHVRSAGFYGSSSESAQRFRNTSIDSYYPLIRRLKEMGYWIIRMGDKSMQPLDSTKCGNSGRVIDYALSKYKSEELDVALCARCELFITAPSGLHVIAHSFGRPVCGINYPIHSGLPWHPNQIFIPQLYYSSVKERVLTFDEIVSTDIIHCNHHFMLENKGVHLIPNEPEDIIEVVIEALSPSTYIVEDDVVSSKVRSTYSNLLRKHNRGFSGQLGKHFAAKYSSYLMPSTTENINLFTLDFTYEE